MPMSPRLLRPIANNLDPDAAVYLNAVAVADGQQLEPAVRKAINDFVVGLKADSIWTPIKALCLLMGPRTLAGALTPLVGTAPTNNGPFVSGDYNRETGLVGNGSSKYLDSNRANSADPQTNYHLAVLVNTAATGAQFYAGVFSTAGGSSSLAVSAGNHTVRCRNNGSRALTGAPTGLLGVSRAASGSYATISGGTTGTQTQSSSTPQADNMLVFANNNDGVAASFTTARIQYYSVGESLDLALLSARLVTLRDAIAAEI
jgi:hypothetical protein